MEEQTLEKGGSSSFRDHLLRPHSDPEVASSCLNVITLQGPVLMSGLGDGMGY